MKFLYYNIKEIIKIKVQTFSLKIQLPQHSNLLFLYPASTSLCSHVVITLCNCERASSERASVYR